MFQILHNDCEKIPLIFLFVIPSAPQISLCGVTPKPHPLDAAARDACAWIGMDAQPQQSMT